MKSHGRSIILLQFLVILFVSALLTVPGVGAQTTSISNLSYPTTPVPNGQATITFDLTYSGLSTTEVLGAFIFDLDVKNYVIGAASSAPNSCISLSGSQLAGKAVCAWLLLSSSGTEHLTFNLQLSTHRKTYSLAATAGAVSTTGQAVYASLSERKFSITAGSKVELTVNTQSTVPITVDGAQQGKGTASILLDPGTHSISVPNTVAIDDMNQLKFESWDDAVNLPTRSLDIESDTTLTASYVTQHKLILSSPMNATGAGWYDDGSTAQFSVQASAPMEGILGLLGGKLQFNGWYENGQLVNRTNSATIQMNGAHTLNAQWQADYTTPIAVLGGIVAVIVVVLALSLRKPKSRKRR